LQANPHIVPSHVTDAFAGGVGHGEHDAPHELTLVFGTHAPLHKWKPAAQTKPQLVPSHVDMALLGGVHGVQLVPHVFTSVLMTHAPLHRW
jgi:hypothetical protein